MVLRLLLNLSQRYAPDQNRLGKSLRLALNVGVFFVTLSTSFGLIRRYVYEVPTADGQSMYATIPESSVLLGVNKRYKKGHGIKVGDCVQIASPIMHGIMSNKRVIGMPGDYVLRSKCYSPTPGSAPVSGITDWQKGMKAEQLVKESDQSPEAIKRIIQETGLENEQEWDEPELIQVPEGHVWVEGDNLAWSRDSRYFGPVPMALIKGRSTWFSDGFFSFTSLDGLRKVEDDELDALLGKNNS